MHFNPPTNPDLTKPESNSNRQILIIYWTQIFKNQTDPDLTWLQLNLNWQILTTLLDPNIYDPKDQDPTRPDPNAQA